MNSTGEKHVVILESIAGLSTVAGKLDGLLGRITGREVDRIDAPEKGSDALSLSYTLNSAAEMIDIEVNKIHSTIECISEELFG